MLLSANVIASDNPIKFRRYSLDQGLSQGTISAIVQDKDGYLWFGTQDGLNRFDGYQFKVFRHDTEQPKSLSSDYINSLLVDSTGVLWIGTSKGLNRFNPDDESFTSYHLTQEIREHISSEYIDEIIQTQPGKLWLGTLGGLFLFDIDEGSAKHYRHQPQQPGSLSNNAVYAFLHDNAKRLWVGTENGLDIFDNQTQTFKHLRHLPADPSSLSGNNITAIAQDHQGFIWVATYDSGLNKLNPTTGKVIQNYRNDIHDFHSIAHDRVRSLLIDNQQRLWVGTRRGISLYDRQRDRFINYRNDPSVPSSLSNDHIWAIFEDDNDSIWFASGDGINQFVQSTQAFGHNHKTSTPGIGISHKRVRSLYKTKDNTLWVGVDNGLNRFDPQTGLYQYFQHDPLDNSSIAKGMVMSILVDSQNRVWAGTYDGGLNLLLPNGQFRRYEANPNKTNSLSHQRVYSIMEDDTGQLWLGTLKGLNRFDPQTEQFTHYQHHPDNPNSLSHDSIYDTLQDTKGNIWIATRNGGLNVLNPTNEKIQRFEHDAQNPKSLSHDRIFALYQSEPNLLWLATSNGLNLLHINQGRFEHFGKNQGLLNSTVYAVTGDDQGFIWVSTNRGLARFDPLTRQFKSFSQIHGLQSDEFNNGAFFKAHDGELFFGGINGFNRFYPDNIKANTQAPKVAISGFYLANKDPGLKYHNPRSPLEQVINRTDNLKLNYSDPVFSFEFTALHFISPQDNKFAFMLEGFDTQWTHTHAGHRRATYTNLPPGRYHFKVKAANGDGSWNQTPKQVTVTITPAPWFTLWAYALYALIIGGTISAFAFQHWLKQKAIAESENRLSLALWGSGNEFWDWDLKTGTLVRSNNSREFTMPCGKGFSMGSLKPLIHPDDFAKVQQSFQKHAENMQDYFECAYRMRNNQGQWSWVLDRGQIIKRNDKGKPLRAIGTVQNIDELKTIEAELRLLNEELENRVELRTLELKEAQEKLLEAEKMAALAGLVTGVAHEINTPVGICVTSTSTLANAASNFFDLQENKKLTIKDFTRFKQTCNESLQLVASNLEKAAHLVQSFKMVSVQQTTDEAIDCDILELFEHVITTHQSHLDDMCIEVRSKGKKDVTLFTHRKSLELIFDQLVENSLQHAFAQRHGGVIELDIDTSDEHINITYRDSGNGLQENGPEKLFEPFYTTARGQGHLGLGMHIVFNHITQRLNGTIEINDSEQGLQYQIRLPTTFKTDNRQ